MVNLTGVGGVRTDAEVEAVVRKNLGRRGTVRLADRFGVTLATLDWTPDGDVLRCSGVAGEAGRPSRFTVYGEDGEWVYRSEDDDLLPRGMTVTRGGSVEATIRVPRLA